MLSHDALDGSSRFGKMVAFSQSSTLNYFMNHIFYYIIIILLLYYYSLRPTYPFILSCFVNKIDSNKFMLSCLNFQSNQAGHYSNIVM